ncbi:TIGR04282 family arsenosugar biosynthesis glycosyltransferase [Methylophaga sp. OBS4]|uniref:TIGR04282 family arsenosugar biosynthesis glycosyltransferase n=1 Tax=Methylophaga sp. OBS4 TaxID=2991935 RepID=UPI0022511F41|nr:TIGR04282 family arsenosugar biosynthesis glycosyltransferase [Methylophaga sp. OBS4]MCX4186523.1 TIGR04282 family arsenosugar biosynthesis glycosyltransferase [Methylophaga sp. OBS4]
MKPVRIVIMAKAPLPGLAKTRLIPALGEDGAALLAQRMLDHTIATALAAAIGPVECCVTPDHLHPVWSARQYDAALHWSSQSDGDLGARMEDVSRRVITDGEFLLLIGTDCPGLEAQHLQLAARWLEHGVVSMIPVLDGGYCLLGLSQFDATLFSNIFWGSAVVAQQTRQRVSQLGWNMIELATLQDIDEPGDLAALPAGFMDPVQFSLSNGGML